MIYTNITKLIEGKNQRFTHIWVTCDLCGDGRWSQPGNANALPEGHLCRPCSMKRSWNGRRIDYSDGYKNCSVCGEHKPLIEFSIDRRKRCGIRSYCLVCMSIRAKEYQHNNRERVLEIRRISQAHRRARKKGEYGRFNDADWKEILEKYGNKCLKCGLTEDLQPDHVIPLSMGGKHDVSNIQPLCGSCNRRKQATIADYR